MGCTRLKAEGNAGRQQHRVLQLHTPHVAASAHAAIMLMSSSSFCMRRAMASVRPVPADVGGPHWWPRLPLRPSATHMRPVAVQLRRTAAAQPVPLRRPLIGGLRCQASPRVWGRAAHGYGGASSRRLTVAAAGSDAAQTEIPNITFVRTMTKVSSYSSRSSHCHVDFQQRYQLPLPLGHLGRRAWRCFVCWPKKVRDSSTQSRMQRHAIK